MVTEAMLSISELMKSYEELSGTSDALAKRKPVSITEVLSRVSTLYRHVFEEAGMTLQLNIPQNLPMVQVQPGHLTQVLLNLMKNAAKHSHGKTVTIDVGQVGDYLKITMADDGDGIHPAIFPNVFERGVTDSENGAGIGLPLCRELIEAEGGEITLASEPGRGTSVTFTLPIMAD
jgi:signal transduction histidine kinase